MKNPSVVNQKMKVPLELKKGRGSGGGGKGNAPWLKVRKRMRKSVFRGM